jgi:hypothetical protein
VEALGISKGISEDFRDCRFPDRYPGPAKINENHEVIGRLNRIDALVPEIRIVVKTQEIFLFTDIQPDAEGCNILNADRSACARL